MEKKGKLKKLLFWGSMATSVLSVIWGVKAIAAGSVAKGLGLAAYGVGSALLTKCLLSNKSKGLKQEAEISHSKA